MKRLLVVLVLLASARAFADVPWAVGVSKEAQQKANALFAEGNQLFAQQAHAPALAKYKQAIALWDHPLIRFNMAVTEIRLDRILDAAEDLEKALRYGDKPFSQDLYAQAQDYERLIAGRVGYIEVTCDTRGAHVQLDGKPWFDCLQAGPAPRKLRVLAGEHAIVAEKSGYMTVSRQLVVAGNSTATAKLRMVPIDEAVVLHYPTPRWIPWTIAASGAALAGGGLAFYIVGKNQMDRFQADFATQCPSGCHADLSDHPALASEQHRALLEGKIAFGLLTAGGAFAVIGTAWATLFDRPTRKLPSVEVTPTPGGAMTTLGWRF